MSEPIKKVQLAIRAEMALARAQLKRTLRSVSMLLLGGVFFLFGFGWLNYAAFDALHESIGTWAGVVVALGDLLIGGGLASVALGEPTQTEEERLAKELREMTYASLNEDVEELHVELHEFAKDVRRIHNLVAGLLGGFSGPVNSLLKIASGLFEAQKSRGEQPGNE